MQTTRAVDVNLRTVEAVKVILEKAAVPVSRNWILEQLRKQGHSTVRQRLNRALSFFLDLGLVVEGSKGVQWTHNDSLSLKRAVATGRRL